MCGICGFVSKRNISEELLEKMNNTMVHRGPNDAGVQIFKTLQSDYNIGLAHRRLSIIDLSEKGHQPMWSSDGKTVIVFNGEIYNFKQLKEELPEYEYKSDTDTEVILAAYQKWGSGFIKKIQGMFGIAIYDINAGILILARDHIGKKPLYYWQKDDEFYFSSELKPLMELPWFEKNINKAVLARYMFQLYINAPDTIFENVYKVEPGSTVTIQVGETLRTTNEKFGDVNSSFVIAYDNQIKSFDEAKAELKELLKESVRKRLVSDVPIGCLLSGGVDSSLVSAVAREVCDGTLKTYTIGFDEKEYDEAIYAKETAKHLGTNHKELYISKDEMIKQVESISRFYDEPFSDSSQIPSMLVSQLVKNDVTVCLTGDGGDELFGGYTFYDRVRLAEKLDKLGTVAYGVEKLPLIGAKLANLYPDKVRKIANNWNPETKTQMNPDVLMNNAYRMIRLEKNMQTDCQYPWESRYSADDWVTKNMLLHLETLLPGDMLCKVDRASMKYSVEMRSPLLDINIVDYSLRIPQKYKYADGVKKFILKELTYEYIPKEMLDRPKTGFSVPLAKWMRGPLKAEISAYAEKDFLDRQGIFEPEFANMFVNAYLDNKMGRHLQDPNNERIVWSFYVFQQWYKMYIA